MSDYEKLYRDAESSGGYAPARPAPGKIPTTARLAPVMRKARDANGVAEGADVAVARASSSSGAPLPEDVRARFESSLGADLSAVRVHTGAESAAAAGAVGAKAYTVGHDIHFADGNYAPSDPFGIHLLAHEVAHTQQQAGGAVRRQHKLEVSAPGDAAEVEADRAADAMVAGAPVAVGRGAVEIARTPTGPSYAQHGGAADDKRDAVGKGMSPGEFAASTDSKKGAAYQTLAQMSVKCYLAIAAASKKKGECGLFEFSKKATYDNLIKEISTLAGQISKFASAIGTIAGSDWASKVESAGKGFDKVGTALDVFQTIQSIGDLDTLDAFIADPSEETCEAWADHICSTFDAASNLVGALPIEVGFIKDYFTGVLKAPSAYVQAFKSIMHRRYAGIDKEAGLSRGKEKLQQGDKVVWEGRNSQMIVQADLKTDGLHDYILANKSIGGHDLGKCSGALAKDLLISQIASDGSVSAEKKAEWMNFLRNYSEG